MQYLIDRLKERSTWLGLIAIATALGVGLTPEHQEAIATLGVAIGGLVAAFTSDNKPAA